MYWLKVAALASLVVFLWTGSYLLFVTAQSEKHVVARADATFSAADAAIQNVNSATAQVGASFTSAAISVSQTEKDVAQVTRPLVGVVSGLQQTVALVNAPCAPGPCGTVADIGKTLNTFRRTAGQLEIAANHEDNNLANLDRQEDQVFNDTDNVLKNFNTLLTSPDLNGTIRNLRPLSDNLVAITGTGEHMLQTGDAVETKATNDYLHPPKNPWVRDWRATYPWLLVGAQGLVKWSPVVP